mmetsp:Transcript_68011/g.196946  ORF Transcript_68011/g.196946 Transcript_68011/m.196946 type:complete len:375 (+) Transcript_68011:139-1263(+)
MSVDKVKSIIFNIPICGGFCAPTESTEQSCLRHFSNEYTVPLAPRYMSLAPCIEFSPCCLGCARIGTRWGSKNRKPIMLCAFGLNVIALALTVVAALGLTTNVDYIRRYAWVRGSGNVSGCVYGCPFDIYIGVQMRLDTINCTSPASAVGALGAAKCLTGAERMGFISRADSMESIDRVVEWSDTQACTRGDDESLNDLCKDCRENLISKGSLITSMVTQLPTMTTDLQRATRFGDVNCQKTMGIVTNIISLFTSLMALIAFRQGCYANLVKDLDGRGIVEWTIGPGFRCLLIATLIKIPDALFHCVVPVPKGKWAKPTEKLTLARYMELGDLVPESPDTSSDEESFAEEDSGSGGDAADGYTDRRTLFIETSK